jgi:hypothetical protein
MERFTPIIHKVMSGSGGSMNTAHIRVLGNVNHPHQGLGNVNNHVKHFTSTHHASKHHC